MGGPGVEICSGSVQLYRVVRPVGAWSNEVTITVVEEKVFDVKSATISPVQDRVEAGKQACFTGKAVFTEPAESSGCIYGDVYIDGEKAYEGITLGSFAEGDTEDNIGLCLVFNKPGTHTVQLYVYTGPCGAR